MCAAFALLTALALAPAARGDLYEPYNYPAGPGTRIAAGSLGDPSNTLVVGGNRLAETGSLFREVWPPETYGAPGTDVWVSWLQRADRNAIAFHGLTLIRREGSTGTGVFFIGEPGSGPGENTYVIGQAGNDATVVSSGVPVVPNQTAFLVAHLEFREGNDLATLYVNPIPGAAAPAGGVTYSGLDMTEIRPVFAFQAIGSGVTFDFDELRIGSTYASVAPPVPEPGSAALVLLLTMGAVGRRRWGRGQRLTK